MAPSVLRSFATAQISQGNPTMPIGLTLNAEQIPLETPQQEDLYKKWLPMMLLDGVQ
jgi:hypothetical protein